MNLHERTNRFRQQYRDGISRYYSGAGHLLFVFGFGGVLMAYCFASGQRPVGLCGWRRYLRSAAW